MKKPYEYEEVIVICHRDDIKDLAFPLFMRSFPPETKEQALERTMPNILDYFDALVKKLKEQEK